MRLARQNQRADNATLQWMADRSKATCWPPTRKSRSWACSIQGQLAAEDVERAVLNVARYDVFGLRDAMLAGDIARTIRMIDGLRARGEALPLVLWAVGEEIRLLARIAEARALGQDANGLMRRLRIFGATNAWRCRRCRACSPRSGRPPCSMRMKSTGSSRACPCPDACPIPGKK